MQEDHARAVLWPSMELLRVRLAYGGMFSESVLQRSTISAMLAIFVLEDGNVAVAMGLRLTRFKGFATSFLRSSIFVADFRRVVEPGFEILYDWMPFFSARTR